ncbi:MAG: hypothetical protein Q8Q59_12010 [Luteolibacter sp.]|jgi:hypothetical protein|nr:hypothetical protein [Luteolibacter sp.]
MKHHSTLPTLEWVKRVNRSWLVRGNLNDCADAWLEHLAALGDGRLETSCAAARAMCGFRNPLDDPKPWFYAGLFSRATVEETRLFLDIHRLTKAALPVMRDKEEVLLWLDQVSPDTRDMVLRIREGIERLSLT